MRIIELNGKKVKIRGTIGGIEKIIRKFKDYEQMHTWNMQRIFSFYYEMMWAFMDGFPKPFLYKRRFFKKVDLDDIRKASDALLEIFTGTTKEDIDKLVEDKELKNVKKLQSRSG
jgi:hypothetical protein